MTAFLPPNLLALFAPREPLPYFPPIDELSWEKKPWLYSGVAQHLEEFEDPSETPAPTRGETRDERRIRKRQEREERYRNNLEGAISSWDPSSNPNISGDPFKTLFVGRINYDTSEGKLRREFESFGPIKRISLITDSSSGKPRGYAFVEYENERDMHAAYKYGDGKKIDGKRVVVDVERGRTVKSWRPRRLGGGLGGTRRGAPNECIKYSGRVDERDMEKERDKDKDREQDRDKRKERDRDRDRGRDRDRDRDRDRRRRSRSKERDRDKRRGRSRSREKDKERKDRSRSRDRDRKDREKKKDKDREKGKDKDKDKSRDKDRDSRKERRESKHEVKKEPQIETISGNTNHNSDNIPCKEEPMEA